MAQDSKEDEGFDKCGWRISKSKDEQTIESTSALPTGAYGKVYVESMNNANKYWWKLNVHKIGNSITVGIIDIRNRNPNGSYFNKTRAYCYMSESELWLNGK